MLGHHFSLVIFSVIFGFVITFVLLTSQKIGNSVISTQWFSLCPTLIISAKKSDKNLLN